MKNSMHVFRSVAGEWIYKGEFNLDTQETSFGSLWGSDKMSFDFPNEENDLDSMESAAEVLPHIFAAHLKD